METLTKEFEKLSAEDYKYPEQISQETWPAAKGDQISLLGKFLRRYFQEDDQLFKLLGDEQDKDILAKVVHRGSKKGKSFTIENMKQLALLTLDIALSVKEKPHAAFQSIPSSVIDGFWKDDFDEEIVQQLHKYLIERSNEKVYSHYVFVTGPSGVGKSFSVSRLTKWNTYVFYLSFQNTGGYPFNVLDWSKIPLNSVESFHCLIITGLEVVFGAIIHKVSPAELIQQLIPKTQDPAGKVHVLFAWIVNRAGQLQNLNNRVKRITELCNVISKMKLELFQYENSILSTTSSDHSFKFVAEHCMIPPKEYFKSLFGCENRINHELEVVLSFDEVHSAKKDSIDGNDLRKALWAIPAGRKCIAVLIDTHSDSAVYSSPARLGTSARAVSGTHHDPFYCFPPRSFGIRDDHLDLILDDGIQTKIGRWLWSSYDNPVSAKNLAKAKLIFSTDFVNLSREAILAIVGARIPIDINSTKVSADLTASYMRYAHYISPERNVYRGGYGIEPILGDAASEFMIKGSPTMLKILQELKDFMKLGILDICQQGELVAALAILRCLDLCCDKKACTVKKFCTKFFGQEVISDSEIPKLTQGKITCTNFARAPKTITMMNVKECAKRSCGLMGMRNQRGFDFLLPVVLQSNDYMLTETNLTVIVIQVKNREEFSASDEQSANLKNSFWWNHAMLGNKFK